MKDFPMEDSYLIEEIIDTLIIEYGYPIERISKSVNFPSKNKKSRFSVDAVVWDEKKKSPLIIVEVKTPHSLPSRDQLIQYMKATEAKYGIWYNGQIKISLGWQNGLVIEIPDIPSLKERKSREFTPIENPEEKFFRIFDLMRGSLRSLDQIELLICILYYKLIDEIHCSGKYFKNLNHDNPIKVLEQLETEAKNRHPDIIFDYYRAKHLPKLVLTEILYELKLFSLKDSNSEAIRQIIFNRLEEGSKIEYHNLPKNVTNLLLDILEINKNEKISIPFTREGKLLYDIMDYCCDKFKIYGKTLREYSNNITCSEINPSFYSIVKFFLLLSDYNVNCHKRSSMFDEEYLNSNVIFALPPFGYIHQNPEVVNEYGRDFENYFITKLVNELPVDGRASIILTPSFLFKETQHAKKLRQHIFDNCKIRTLIQLPAGLFYPLTGIETVVISIEKTKPKKDYNIFMADIDVKLEKNQHLEDDILNEIKTKYEEFRNVGKIKEETPLGFVVSAYTINQNDWTIRDKAPIYHNLNFESTVNLREVAEIIAGKDYIQTNTGIEIPQIRASDLGKDEIESIKRTIKIPKKNLENAKSPIVKKRDLVLSIKGDIGKIGVMFYDDMAIIGSNLAIIRPNLQKIDPDYLWQVMNEDIFKFQLRSKTRGVIPTVPIKNLSEIRIPLPPLKEQQKKVEKLKEFRNKIDYLKIQLKKIEDERQEYLEKNFK